MGGGRREHLDDQGRRPLDAALADDRQPIGGDVENIWLDHRHVAQDATLYAEHGVPYYWIVDPESRSIEAYALAGAEYARAGRVTSEPAALPPFNDLTIDPASIWP